jgi:hypothetical protein
MCDSQVSGSTSAAGGWGGKRGAEGVEVMAGEAMSRSNLQRFSHSLDPTHVPPGWATIPCG